jgi:formylglycine-generating enzyme required for sulfatase activity
MDLPTEAQWEYAARSRGRWLIWATDNGEIDSGRNFPRDGEGFGETQNVGSYPPNPLGVYDMAANSKEWVADWHSETYYAESPAKDPNGPSSGNEKVLRGGFNGVSPTSSFTVSRMGLPPQRNEYTRLLSFRCAARTTR